MDAAIVSNLLCLLGLCLFADECEQNQREEATLLARRHDQAIVRRILRLPLEIRSYIWKYMVKRIWMLDTNLCIAIQQGTVSFSQTHVRKLTFYYGWRTVMASDHNENTIMREFLMENASTIDYYCASVAALREFITAAAKLWAPMEVPALQVVIPIFSNRKWKSLALWAEFSGETHGARQNAPGHVRWWMHALRKLPQNIAVHIVMYQPWRDYIQLAELTAALRNHGRKVYAAINSPQWGGIHNANLHRSLTIAAITGGDMDHFFKSVDDTTARMYHIFGCTGFSK